MRPDHARRDGTNLPLEIPDGWQPPLDPNCRCVLRVLTKKLTDLGLPKRVSDILKPVERASMSGPIKAQTTYAQWFDTQPAERKRDILGDSTYEKALKAGRGRVLWTAALKAFGLRKPVSATLAALRAAAKRAAQKAEPKPVS